MLVAASHCATCLRCGTGEYFLVVAAVRVVVVHGASRVEATVFIVVVPVVVIDKPPRFWRDACAFCGSGPEGGDCGPWVT